MLASEIEDFFSSSHLAAKYIRFKGVFAIDTFPKNVQTFEDELCIINRDKSNEKGSHWFCLCNIDGNVELFDSLSSSKEFVKSLSLESVAEDTIVAFNITPVQSTDSKLCGAMCLYYAFVRFLNPELSLQEIIDEYFYEDLALNDDLVRTFMETGKINH